MADGGDETKGKRRRRSRRSGKESDVPKFVSMEYALKRMLRAKANFDVLEGFLGEMLQDDVEILEILESESNREREDDKQTRVDLKARLAGGEIVIIEGRVDDVRRQALDPAPLTVGVATPIGGAGEHDLDPG